jgi:hypothetical protein
MGPCFRYLGAAVGGTLLLLSALAQAQNADEEPVNEAAEKEWYDNAHGWVSSSLDDAVDWFDEFFGDPRADIATDASAFVRLRFDGFYSGVDDETDFKVRVKGSADLPRFERKVKLVFNSDADTAISGEQLVDQDAESRRTDGDGEAGVGLSYLFRDDPRHRFFVTGGLKGGIPPEVFVAGRYRYTLLLGSVSRMRLTNTLYWKSDDGFGVSALADFERRPKADTVWRYTLFGDYGEETDGLEWSTKAIWRRRLDNKTAISVRAGIRGETEPRQLLEEGWTAFTYRRNFLRPWLFYEVEPGLSWHEKVDYGTEPTLALRLEILFYKD